MRKNFLCKALAIATIVAVSTTSVLAASPGNIEVQGQQVKLEEGVEAKVIDDCMYIPIRAFFEALGYDVGWDEVNQAVSLNDPLKISGFQNREQKIDAAVWQLSAEARACFIQAFNLATLKLDEKVANKKDGEKLALIADIDDTLVDGVMYTADVLQDGPWTDEAFGKSLATDTCLAIPGAVEFMNYAQGKDVEVFYLTNRSSLNKQVTQEQLMKLGFPNADWDHIFIMEDGAGSNKEGRRNAIEANYNVVMLLGDNLADFDDIFDRKLGVDGRRDAVDSVYDLWGDKFIILPNAVYGDWEGAVYYNDKTLSAEQKIEAKVMLFDEYKYTN